MFNTPHPSDPELEIHDLDPSPVQERYWSGPLHVVRVELLKVPHMMARPWPMRRPPWRVCLSHTSELRDHPSGLSYVDAAEIAVVRAGHVARDMLHTGAEAVPPAKSSRTLVLTADVYVGIIGLRYGGVVPGEQRSFTELEFDTATEARMPRLVFVIDKSGLPAIPQSARHRVRQARFRDRLRDAGVTYVTVETPEQLKFEVYDALVRLAADQVC